MQRFAHALLIGVQSLVEVAAHVHHAPYLDQPARGFEKRMAVKDLVNITFPQVIADRASVSICNNNWQNGSPPSSNGSLETRRTWGKSSQSSSIARAQNNNH